jgi:thiamine biosynthesis lipoprotein
MTTDAPPDRHFSHEAMNTTFHLHLRGLDEATAAAISRECFEHIDFLENRLSRFIEGSDVSRINRMNAGETLYLSEPCHQCLLLALDAFSRTAGLFDVTLGTRIQHRKTGNDGPPPPITGSLTIHPDVPAITCGELGREIDLGGIGKGFALDQLRQILADWGAEDALLSAGASSITALGPQPWPVDLTGDGAAVRIQLSNQSLAASGTAIQGSHIVHPAGDHAMPASPCGRVWVVAHSAALAEIWSTALMLLPPEQMPDFLAGDPGIISVHAEREGRITPVPITPAS